MSRNCIEYVCVHVNDDGSKDFLKSLLMGEGAQGMTCHSRTIIFWIVFKTSLFRNELTDLNAV